MRKTIVATQLNKSVKRSVGSFSYFDAYFSICWFSQLEFIPFNAIRSKNSDKCDNFSAGDVLQISFTNPEIKIQ